MGYSKGSIHGDSDENKISFVDENSGLFMPSYAYDPRLVKVEDIYYGAVDSVVGLAFT